MITHGHFDLFSTTMLTPHFTPTTWPWP